MPRKAFVAGLQSAVASFQKPNVSDLEAGGEDGTINFKYHMGTGMTTEITILVPDLGEYPESHIYMIYTNSENVPRSVHSALDNMDSFMGVKVADMIDKVVKVLDIATAGSQHNPVDLDDGDPVILDSDHEPEDSDVDELGGFDSDEEGSWYPNSGNHESALASHVRTGYREEIKVSNARIRNDLRLAKQAGFKVGHLGSLLDGGRDAFVTISIRVSKLGISEEALKAWHLDPAQYFILLIRYTDGYKSLDTIIGQGMLYGKSKVQMRVGLNERYKIAIDEAVAAFSSLEDKSKTKRLLVTTQATARPKKLELSRLFIGRPLDELLNDRLGPLLRYRVGMGFPWHGAEEFFNESQGRNIKDEDIVDTKYWAPEPSKGAEALPAIVTNDHLRDNEKERSFPLLAMQFALRHLVRCTEFCLVCHCRVEADFEALKPYVCSKPLCLYQYMSLGFGPSIEHEIITQPHVMDLLISFCYASAHGRKIRHLPTGMALMVPNKASWDRAASPSYEGMPASFPPPILGTSLYQPPPPKKSTIISEIGTFKAKLDRQRMELLFPSSNDRVPLTIGTWVVLSAAGASGGEQYHCRVTDALFPTIRLGKPIILYSAKLGGPPSIPVTTGVSQRLLSTTKTANIPPMTPAATPPPLTTTELRSPHLDVDVSVYDQNFDDLNNQEKQAAICMLLNTLPSVKEMTDYLHSKGGHDTPLRTWHDRITPAALGVLRWIIASNRSCIVQVDSMDGTAVARKAEERVSGMPNWMQFRFAQGAPDKEQRFVTSIRDTTPNAKHPTLFAWHGSPLHNWHSIVREGLHFERTDHGRAFGHGVYFSMQVSTSLGYSGVYGLRGSDYQSSGYGTGQWPHSQLKISQAIALNEIVNAPSKFVSSNPHLVVAQLDWIQSRYLFVQCNVQGYQIPETKPTQEYEQDPSYQPVGSNNEKVIIPITAVSKSRRTAGSKGVKSGNKKVKIEGSSDIVIGDEPVYSDGTDVSDLEIFFSDEEEPVPTKPGRGKALPALPSKCKAPDKSQTDFKPGTLDHKSLPVLEPPSYATSTATRALQRELTATLKVQDTHPAHELGWYIDRELISNVYQWIIELHSFEPHLPLAKDMNSKNLKSVVLEVRFGKDYPISPPFVRVIRPRFLSFLQGGGGHITAGGALCMELLTNSGWSAASNIESVLLQVRLAIISTDPHPARLEPGPVRDYGVGEAIEAFIRACNAHGWQIPVDFQSFSGSSGGYRPGI